MLKGIPFQVLRAEYESPFLACSRTDLGIARATGHILFDSDRPVKGQLELQSRHILCMN